MTILLQIASLLVLVALAVGWGNWVYDTHRPIRAPQSLGEVVLHGVAAEASESTARSLALGVAATVADHYRTVDFINNAAETAGAFLIQASTAAPEPLLLQSKTTSDRLDVTVEFAGAKLDSKGLLALFKRQGRRRGSLSLAVTLGPSGEEGKYLATASASFPENSAYGFQTRPGGTLDVVAEQIGLRFVQAHYAVGDPFYGALSEEDFRKIWQVRKEAAEMALRGTGADPTVPGAMQNEAHVEYEKIAHLLTRYTRRAELQQLGGFLAQAMGDLEGARAHFVAASNGTAEEEERQSLNTLVAALDVEIQNRSARRSKITAALRPVEAPTGTVASAETSELEVAIAALTEKNAAVASALKIPPLQADGAQKRVARIGIVLGRPHPIWDERVTYVGGEGKQPNDFFADHAGSVLSLVAALAPKAELVVSPVGGVAGSSGAVTSSEITQALMTLAQEDLDVIFLDFGSSARSFGKDDGAERWAEYTASQLDAMAGFGGLAVLPSGNDNVSVPPVSPGQNAPAFVIVGALQADGNEAPYTNKGQGVDYYAPGEVMVLWTGATLAAQRGTSFAAAGFAAGAVLLAGTLADAPGGEALKTALSKTGVKTAADAGPVPDFAAAATNLARP